MKAYLKSKYKRRCFHRKSSPRLSVQQRPQDLATTTTTSHATRPAASGALVATGNHLLDQTLQRLSIQDRRTLGIYISLESCDSALHDSLAVAEKNQQIYRDNRQTVQIAGRSVVLRDQVDGIVRWLNRFKAVGDIAVNANPVCAGLPWVGIRMLLEVGHQSR